MVISTFRGWREEMGRRELPVRSKEYQKRMCESMILGGRNNHMPLGTLFLNLGLRNVFGNFILSLFCVLALTLTYSSAVWSCHLTRAGSFLATRKIAFLVLASLPKDRETKSHLICIRGQWFNSTRDSRGKEKQTPKAITLDIKLEVV